MMWNAGQHVFNGHYVIERKLGEGGFGITYLAKTPTGDRKVIKTLHDKVLNNPTRYPIERDNLLQNFRKETAILLECRHPNIVRVESFFEEDGLPCLVMEYIEGGTLREQMHRRGALSEAEALQYIQQVGDALTLVHGKKLLHRDINPNNIMRRANIGEAVLIDFGIAREFIRNMPQSHTALATPGYAPLEQYYDKANRGEYTDVYALAATLYALLTGESPVSALDRQGELHEQQTDPLKPLSQVNPKVSNRVSDAVILGMALDYKQRPQTVQQWLRLLGESSGETTTMSPEMPETPILPDPQSVLSPSQAWKCVQTITNYSHSTGKVIFSPSGKILASGYKDAKLWDVFSGQEIHIFPDSGIPLAFSTDGRMLACARSILNVETGEVVQEIRTHSLFYRDHIIAISPDFQTIVGYDGFGQGSLDTEYLDIKLWKTATQEEIGRFSSIESAENFGAYERCPQFSPDGLILACIPNRLEEIKLWNVITGAEVCSIPANKDYYYTAKPAFSPNGKILASASHKGFDGPNTIQLWEVATGKQLCKIKVGTGYDNEVLSVAFSPDGQMLAIGNRKGNIQLWQLSKRWQKLLAARRICTFESSANQGVVSTAFSPNSKILAASAGYDNHGITLWNVEDKRAIKALPGHAENSSIHTDVFIAISPNGQTAANYFRYQSVVKLWRTQSGTFIRCLKLDHFIRAVAFSSDGESLIVVDCGSITIWNIANGRKTQSISQKFSQSEELVLSQDGEILATSQSKIIKLLETCTDKTTGILKASAPVLRTIQTYLVEGIWQIAFSANKQFLAASDVKHTIEIYEVEVGKVICTINTHPQVNFSFAFSPNGQFLAVGDRSHITLWKVSSGQKIHIIHGNFDAAYPSLAFSFDGQTLANCSEDGLITLWNVVTGNKISTLSAHISSCIAFSRNGQVLVSGGEDGTIKIWQQT